MRFAALVVSLLVLIAAPRAQDAAELVSRASAWADRFETGLSGLLFRESYRQSATTESVSSDMTASPLGLQRGRTEGNRGARFFEANIFLVKPELAENWVVYRDIYNLGARELTDHTNRLEEILTQDTESARSRAQRLTDMSARLNVGEVLRNVNIPTMAFEFLRPANLSALRVRAAGRDKIDGLQTVVVEFEELARPTLIRGPDDSDVPARGRYWISPETGAVPRAILDMQVGRYTGKLEVRLEFNKDLNVWLPAKMLEAWYSGNWRINGFAVYDRFKRLRVSTDEIIK